MAAVGAGMVRRPHRVPLSPPGATPAAPAMTSIRVRRANPNNDDDLAVLALLRWWWLASDNPSGGSMATSALASALSDRDALARYQDQLAAWWRPRAGAHLAVVVEELPDALARGQVPVAVGMGWLSLTEPLPWELFGAPRTAFVHSLYVLPALRGRGVARLILGELEAVGRAAGLDELLASVDAAGSPVLLDAGYATDARVGLARRPLTGVGLPPAVDVPVGQGSYDQSGGLPGPAPGRAVAS